MLYQREINDPVLIQFIILYTLNIKLVEVNRNQEKKYAEKETYRGRRNCTRKGDV